jgi:LPS-assembly protein
VFDRVIADKATFVFFDFPLFYLPKYSWISQGRGSGFLTPSFNIYKESGLESSDWLIRAPFYINIAPDKDLLITPAYLSSRGALYQGRYRQLIDPSKSQDEGLFEFEFKYLNNDYITNLNRWLIDTSVELDLTDKTHFSLRYNKVSDSEFFT